MGILNGLFKTEIFVILAMLAAFALPLRVKGQTLEIQHENQSRCLFSAEQSAVGCDLLALANGFRIVIGEDGTAGIVLLTQEPVTAKSSDPNLVEKSSVDIDADLEAGVEEQHLDPSEANQILMELRQSPDFSYVAPKSPESLKNELGFNTSIRLNAADLVELIRVHIQLALGFSPLTSGYLAHQMKIALREPAAETAPIVSAAPAVATQEESVIPKPWETSGDAAKDAAPVPVQLIKPTRN